MSNETANSRINNLWERLALGLLSLVMAIMFLAYQEQRGEFKELESKVASLQMDKVSKQDLREVEQRLLQGFDARFSQLQAQQESNKQDILQRIDLYFKKNL